MITYSGIHVSVNFGTPCLHDIAVQSMRLDRFGGACRVFWPVGMHQLLVADLGPKLIEHHLLIHDGPEICVGDVCRPFKTEQARGMEDRLHLRMYKEFGLKPMTKAEHRLMKKADTRAVAVEGEIIGPRGFSEWWRGKSYEPDAEAEALLKRYMHHYDPMECLNPEGRWVLEYERRCRIAIVSAQGNSAYAEEIL